MTKVNSEAPHQRTHSPNLSNTSSTLTSDDASVGTNTIRCVQSNLRRSHQAQVNLFLDVLNNNVYKDGINVIFVTEPYTVSKSNSLLDVPNDVFYVFAERGVRTALVTAGVISWKVPQYCSKDVIVCQTNINNKLTFLVSLYLDGKVLGFPKEFVDLMRNVGNNDILTTQKFRDICSFIAGPIGTSPGDSLHPKQSNGNDDIPPGHCTGRHTTG